MTEMEKEINNLRSGLKSVESVSSSLRTLTHYLIYLTSKSLIKYFLVQELEYQSNSPQQYGDKFVSVVSQFITLASFSFSDVEDSLNEAKELVSMHLFACAF